MNLYVYKTFVIQNLGIEGIKKPHKMNALLMLENAFGFSWELSMT